MEFQNVFQEMLNVAAAPPDPVAEALRRAGILADAPYMPERSGTWSRL